MIFLYFEIFRQELWIFRFSRVFKHVKRCILRFRSHGPFHMLVNSEELFVVTRRDERLILARGWPFFNFLPVAFVVSRAFAGPIHVCRALFCCASTMNKVSCKRWIESMRIARTSFPDITDIGRKRGNTYYNKTYTRKLLIWNSMCQLRHDNIFSTFRANRSWRLSMYIDVYWYIVLYYIMRFYICFFIFINYICLIA